MPEESKRVVLLIFLFAVFIFLAIIIFVFSFSLERGSSNYSETTSKAAIECVGYSFRIVGGSINYTEGELSFIVEPAGGGSLNRLVVKSGENEIETKNIDFSASYRQNVKVVIDVSEGFELFPKRCGDNVKVCSIASGMCETKS